MPIKTFHFKLYPTAAQRHTFAQWVNACRFAYNLTLDYKQYLYRAHGKTLSKADAQKELTPLCRDYPWLACVHSQVVQDVTDRLYRAYDTYFRNVKSGKIDELKKAYLAKCLRLGRKVNPHKLANMGKVKFARKGEYRSFGFKQKVKLHEDECTVQLPKIGRVRYISSQRLPVGSTIKCASVSQQADGWYVSLVCETTLSPMPTPINDLVGVDVGLTTLVTLSNGQKSDNPKPLYKAQHRLARDQRSLSRKVKGSNNYQKAKVKLARQHQRTVRVRKDNLHKLTTRLVRENQAICVEQLAIVNMVKNHKLAKSIHDASWGELNRQLAYKCVWYGRVYEKVPPHYTTQDCSTEGCGFRNSELTLRDRVWKCPSCKCVHDRDINAALNIRNKGGRFAASACQITDASGQVGKNPRGFSPG